MCPAHVYVCAYYRAGTRHDAASFPSLSSTRHRSLTTPSVSRIVRGDDGTNPRMAAASRASWAIRRRPSSRRRLGAGGSSRKVRRRRGDAASIASVFQPCSRCERFRICVRVVLRSMRVPRSNVDRKSICSYNVNNGVSLLVTSRISLQLFVADTR